MSKRTRDWYYRSGMTSKKWLFFGPIEQSVCKKYLESVEQCKKPEESILHLMKVLHHKHISAVRFIFSMIFQLYISWHFQWYFNYIFHDIFNDIVLAFWICWFGGVRGKLNLKSTSNLSAFHLPFPISKIYSYNRS